MDTDSSEILAARFVERLTQAVRVMEGLSETDMSNFTLEAWAEQRPTGLCACIAGHCGLDPWFRERGFVTTVEEEGLGKINMFPEVFFGTTTPFYARFYPLKPGEMFEDPSFDSDERPRHITPDDAIAALKTAIASFQAWLDPTPA